VLECWSAALLHHSTTPFDSSHIPPTIPKSDIDVAKWVEALSYINEIDASIIVPGHGSLGQAEIARSLLVYFTDCKHGSRSWMKTETLTQSSRN
jgi:hypothetical protein